MRTLTTVAILAIGGGCSKETFNAETVTWDDASAIDWHMPDVQGEPVAVPSSFSKGGGGNVAASAGAELWTRLKAYDQTYLKTWRQALASDAPPSPDDIVDAFNELAFAVTGPAGFWRQQVPNRWFGCANEAGSAPCLRLGEMSKELTAWDDIQKQIGELDAGRAGYFLAHNQARIVKYLETYVPATPSFAGMKETPFYKTRLAATLDAVAPPTDGNDL